MSAKQQSIIGGITVLSVTGIICKLIAVLYRIPLAWLIGDQGLGTFGMVFPTYSLLLTISSAGLPVAISRIISYKMVKGDIQNIRRTFRTALLILTGIGLIGTLLMIIFRTVLSERVGDPLTLEGFVAIAPAVAIVCTMSAFRGYMQGQQDMKPTAISQLIEQIAKVAIALPLAWLGSKVGMDGKDGINIGYAAAGALLGTSIAEALALVYMFFVYMRRRHDLDSIEQNIIMVPEKRAQIISGLMTFAIPITIGASIIPLSSFIDSGMIVNRLVSGAGFTLDTARAMYGRFSGYVITLINVPTALALAISMSMVPAISANLARSDKDGVKRSTHSGLRMAFLLGLPCSFGMSILAEPILAIFPLTSPDALAQTAKLLSYSSFTIILFTVVQATSGILQGLHKQRIPMYTLLIGVGFKVLINYFLIATPNINILGASIGSLVCYSVSMAPNLYFVHKYTGLKPDPIPIFIKPLFASAVMSGSLYMLMQVLPANLFTTFALILFGIIIYCVVSILIGSIKKDEISMLAKKIRK